MKSTNKRFITCPFCSLHCDDIEVEINSNKIKVLSEPIKNCTKKIEYFNISDKSNLKPFYKNKSLNYREAIIKSRTLLDKSQDITIVNHGTDVNGVRSILNFATHHNCTVDHINSKYLFKNLGIVQRKGYMATSLTEARNRCDVFLLFGKSILKKSPRLIDKVIFPEQSLCVKPKEKKLILIGEFDKKTIDILAKNYFVRNIKIKINEIPQLMELIQSKSIGKNDNIKAISNIISESKYLVASWSSSDLDVYKNADDVISSISDFILMRNKENRAACMPISGSLADATSSQTMTWLTGYPSRVKFDGSKFIHDRNICDSEFIIENNHTDIVMHISTVGLEKIKLNKKVKNIVIGHPNTTYSSKPDIFIPVGIPGIDHKSILFRTDNVVSLSLDKIRCMNLPSVKNIINDLLMVQD